MGELIDQRQLRTSCDHRIEVHLLQDLVLVGDALALDDFEPPDQGLGLGPSMGLDEANDHVDSRLELGVGAREHLIGFADAGRRADEDLQLPGRTVLPPGSLQQGFRRGTLIWIAALTGHATL